MKRLLIFLVSLLTSTLITSCKQGTESGTESNFQGIQGGVQRDNALPVVGAEVYIFLRSNLASKSDSDVVLRILQNPDTLKDPVRFKLTKTDSKGFYQFHDLPAGNYGIISLYSESTQKGKWIGYNPTVTVSSGALTEVGMLNLRQLGGISAVVYSATPNSLPLENIMCHVPGVSYVAFSDSLGNCTLLNIPEGVYTVAFDLPGYISEKVGPLAVEPGAITLVPDTVKLILNPAGPPPAPKDLSITADSFNRLVSLKWTAVSVSDIVGYVLYRRPVDSIGYVVEKPLNYALIRGTTYIDTLYLTLADTAGLNFVYRIAAMDVEGNLSPATLFPPVEIKPSPNPIRIQFTGPQFSGIEGSTTLISKVRRTGPVNRSVTVKWTYTNFTAERNIDFTAVTGELTFLPGDTIQSLPTILLNDLKVETDEIFYTDLVEPTRGAVLGSISRATLKIQNDDSVSRITCIKPTQVLIEGDNTGIVISRSGDLDRGFSIQYRLTGIPANNSNKFFEPDSGWLEFKPKTTSLSIPLKIFEDTLQGLSRYISLRFSASSNDVDLSACPDIYLETLDSYTQFKPFKIDLKKAAITYNEVKTRPQANFPQSLFDGDYFQTGLSQYKFSNPELEVKPIADWDFQDLESTMIPDRSGNGNFGTIIGKLKYGSDSSWPSGKVNWTEFNGNEVISIDQSNVFNFADGITLTAIVRPDSLAEPTASRKTRSICNIPGILKLNSYNGKIEASILINDKKDSNNSYQHVSDSAAQYSSAWLHLALTSDGEITRLYINGNLVSEDTSFLVNDGGIVKNKAFTGVLGKLNGPIAIGQGHLGGLKKISLFKTVLNPEQIREEFKTSFLPTKPLQVTLAFPDPVWTMGASIFPSGTLGTTKYLWNLTAANSIVDLETHSGSFINLIRDLESTSDRKSTASFKPRALKYFKYIVAPLSGTRNILINELELSGAERVKP